MTSIATPSSFAGAQQTAIPQNNVQYQTPATGNSQTSGNALAASSSPTTTGTQAPAVPTAVVSAAPAVDDVNNNINSVASIQAGIANAQALAKKIQDEQAAEKAK